MDVDYFCRAPDSVEKGQFALAAGRMIGYKRLDLAVRACARLRHPLVVAGAGPEERRLRALAAEMGGPVEFVVAPDDETLRNLYRRAQVLLFPGEEDFGIVPVEAQACGTPVVGYGKGGILDTVLPGVTGVLVPEQDECSLAAGLEAVLAHPLDPSKCRENAERFSAGRFRHNLRSWVGHAARARGLDLGVA